jgi:hypothetical protein
MPEAGVGVVHFPFGPHTRSSRSGGHATPTVRIGVGRLATARGSTIIVFLSHDGLAVREI